MTMTRKKIKNKEETKTADIAKIFGSLVFGDKAMKERLPEDVYKAVKRVIETGMHLDIEVAYAVANAMKEWALAHGATHYTHWFQPMTGVTAEKHDSFIAHGENGGVIMEFSGKELIKGESDASSFPSGGLRATFEARGYTAWDPTAYAFIKDNTLCIPTVFCSFSGETLDKKTPLLRSMQALDREALRITKLFGAADITRIIPMCGPEQEYFLIDKKIYEQRPDLFLTGRTLFGARPTKGQELGDHYFGSIKTKVKKYMVDLDRELWKLGILSKTEHNEVAPAQHELAPLYTTVNSAADQNQLTMEMMKKVAERHGLACLLHEKPFKGISGSGKHNNWSIAANTGKNLLEPGKTPAQNAQFLVFLTAFIKAVDDYQDLLRISVASAGNDHRLGAHEAPPAIVSIFLGDELTEILEAIENETLYAGKEKKMMEIGVSALPHFPKDTTDRNRTSPIAFTGNKFEFRMPGSAFSISDVNTVINTIVAETLKGFADRLEKSADLKTDLTKLIKETITNHKRIIFNGNSYSADWIAEARKRGLSVLKDTVDALARFKDKKHILLLEKHKVLSKAEIDSRYEILTENYNKTINIEALTFIDMVHKGIIPSIIKYEIALTKLVAGKNKIDKSLDAFMESAVLKQISELSKEMYIKLDSLEKSVKTAGPLTARYMRDEVLGKMNELREIVDKIEMITAEEYWAYPTYSQILYSIK